MILTKCFKNSILLSGPNRTSERPSYLFSLPPNALCWITTILIYVYLPIINYVFTYFLGFDENGVRKLKVVNPNGNHFEPIDPDLVKYLTNRNNIKWGWWTSKDKKRHPRFLINHCCFFGLPTLCIKNTFAPFWLKILSLFLVISAVCKN